MANITYIEASGQSATVNLADGWSLMQGATANGIDGILGECGGSCACATCHCYVDEAHAVTLPPPGESELSMLEAVAAERRPNSRYAAIENCKQEVAEAEKLMRKEGIRWLDSSTKSIEEISTTILQEIDLERNCY